jgi:hypothetical protein
VIWGGRWFENDELEAEAALKPTWKLHLETSNYHVYAERQGYLGGAADRVILAIGPRTDSAAAPMAAARAAQASAIWWLSQTNRPML